MVGLFLFLPLMIDAVFSQDLVVFRIADLALLAVDENFLYRAVKSLAPLSRIPLVRSVETS